MVKSVISKDNGNYSELAEKMFSSALHFISYKDRTKDEVIRKLNKSSISAGLNEDSSARLISAVVRRLESEKLIDDTRYVRQFVYSIKNSSKPRGEGYIKQYLAKKGIPETIVAAELQSQDQEQELENAIDMGKKKSRLLKNLPLYKQKTRLWSYLARKGFAGDIISSAVDIILGVK